MQENLRKRSMSLLLIKPEFFLLSRDDQEKIQTTLSEKLNGNVLERHTIMLPLDQARSIWSNIQHHSWSTGYYQSMVSAPCIILVLDGDDRALTVRNAMREEFRSQIKNLTTRIGGGFQADIFHGSDPGRGERELKILGLLLN
jgi:hypothetical protein